MNRSIRIWRWAALTSCVIIAVAVFAAPGPNINLRSAIAIHDFGHVMAFGLVTGLFAFALNACSRTTLQGRAGVTCLAAGAALVLGAAVELAQAFTGRNGDLWDVVRDAGGALSVALVLTALEHAISNRARGALVSVAIFILVAFAYPVYVALDDEAGAQAQFPVLASFETTRELSRFHIREGMNPRIVSITDDDGRVVSAMQLHFPPGRYPGFEFRYFPRDWRGMRTLRLLIVNPEHTATRLTVRIDDAKYRLDLDDRFNQSFPLLPGLNRIEISLSDVAVAPRNRKFDLGNVYSLLVFAVDIEQPRSIIIEPITLVR